MFMNFNGAVSEDKRTFADLADLLCLVKYYMNEYFLHMIFTNVSYPL